MADGAPRSAEEEMKTLMSSPVIATIPTVELCSRTR
jgi:hypothetical protein